MSANWAWRIFLATPRLRGLLALNFAVAAAGAMVIVNTVVIVQALLGRPQHDVALALGPFGAGSMAAALVLPRVLDRLSDRGVMLPSAAFLGVVLVGVAALTWCGAIGWPVLLGTWLVLGIGYSAAQFALSHASWLLTYPLAGCLGAAVGMAATLAALGALTVAGVAAAAMLRPASDPDVVAHAHADLNPSHPHVRGIGQGRHEHAFVIDDLHRQWPSRAN